MTTFLVAGANSFYSTNTKTGIQDSGFPVLDRFILNHVNKHGSKGFSFMCILYSGFLNFDLLCFLLYLVEGGYVILVNS